MEYAASMQKLRDTGGNTVAPRDCAGHHQNAKGAVVRRIHAGYIGFLALAVVVLMPCRFRGGCQSAGAPGAQRARGGRRATGCFHPCPGGDEIGELAVAFNEMVQNLKQSNDVRMSR